MINNRGVNKNIHKNGIGDRFYFVDDNKISRITDSVLIVEKTIVWLLIWLVVVMFFNNTYETDAEFLPSLLVFLYIAYVINKFIFRKTDRVTQEIDSCLLYDKDGVLWKINITELNKDYKYCFTKDTFKNPITINQARLSDSENIALKDSILRAIYDFKYNITFYGATNNHTYISKYNNIFAFIRKPLSYICRYKDEKNISRYIKIYRIYSEHIDEQPNEITTSDGLVAKKIKNKKYHFHIIVFKMITYGVAIIMATQISVIRIFIDIIRVIYP